MVSASERTQVERLVARDGMTEADARARIAAQLPVEDKKRVADWVIENDGTRSALEARVREVDASIRARFGGVG